MARTTTTATRPRGVSFSKYSGLAFIPKDGDVPNDQKWYSSQDTSTFRRALIDDVRRILSSHIDGKDDAGTTHNPEMKYERVGIEVFLARGLARQIQETKRAHADAILSEQRAQRHLGICDIEKLASVSKKTLRSSERARIQAIGYWLQHIFETE